MRWVGSLLVGLSALASGCSYRSATAGEPTSSALVCDRARSEAEANSVRAAGNRQAGGLAFIAARAAYELEATKTWEDGRQSRGPVRLTPWRNGFTIRENRWAEQCRLARERERQAELERQQAILTPPR